MKGEPLRPHREAPASPPEDAEAAEEIALDHEVAQAPPPEGGGGGTDVPQGATHPAVPGEVTWWGGVAPRRILRERRS